ncbi:uncharacterized protein CIMG_06290 [Coccidioides immitis RS]|uniref:Uncharacterized protein n=1 Tax=Coccidioides immitis (strain RS) TaxID=246410 RepID=J3K7U4_COCIM|nr:uncharacterized protein CIMG_06290 [Coccidioides immitis RS]EAS30811.3 hypothetical protein CIMG_06290 [Coccidioides immitis RS]
MQDSGCVLLGSLAVSLHTHMREKFFLTTTYALGSWKLKKKDVWALDGDRGKRVGALGLTNLSPTALIIQRVAERFAMAVN